MTGKIFATGVIGTIGTKLVKFLFEKNAPVTVYVRDAEKANKLYPKSENLHIVQGDYSTMDVFEREIAGHSRLFTFISDNGNVAEIKRSFAKIAYAKGVCQVVDISSGKVDQPFRASYIGCMHRGGEEAILAEKK
jgi:uncharacterized protein YbjT (DUF2867 family)